MAKYVGKDCTVKVDDVDVVGMGTWTMNGVATEKFDQSQFLDEWKTYLFGMKEGGTVSFNGHCDLADVTGQRALLAANVLNSALTNVKFYVDGTSYWEPCQTSGFFASGAYSTGMGTPDSDLHITEWNIGADKSGIVSISFTADINGAMVLV